MPKNYTERFEDEGDKFKYIRTVTLLDGRTADIEVYLTKDYLNDTDADIAERYLNNAVAAILTRNGVEANEPVPYDVTVEAEEPDAN